MTIYYSRHPILGSQVTGGNFSGDENEESFLPVPFSDGDIHHVREAKEKIDISGKDSFDRHCGPPRLGRAGIMNGKVGRWSVRRNTLAAPDRLSRAVQEKC